MSKVKLSKDEKELLDSVESGKFDSTLTEARRKELEATATNTFKKDCFEISKPHLSTAVYAGADEAGSESDSDDEDDWFIGRRAIDKFIHSYSKKSLDICLEPYITQVCKSAQVDEDGNNSLYLIYGLMSSLDHALQRLTTDQLRTATRFGFARAARSMGYTSIQLGIEDGARKTIEFKGPIMYRNLIPTLNETDELKLGDKLIDYGVSDD